MDNEEKMFRAHWHLICHESELRKEGAYVALNWYKGQQVVATRQHDEIIVFDNRCPHRGKQLFSLAPTEAFHGDAAPMQCGYHGWRYTVGCEGLRRIPCAWFGSFLYASEEPTFSSPAAMMGEPEQEDHAIPLMPHSAFQFTQACDWRVAVENTLEADHVATVHATSPLADAQLTSDGISLYAGGLSLERFSMGNPRAAALLDFMQPAFEDRGDYPDYMHALIFPFSAIATTRGCTYSIQQYFPRADGGCAFLSRLYSTPATADVSDYLETVARSSAQVFREDAEICDGVPVQHHTNTLRKTEARIKHFRETLEHWGVR